jgi:hypothetical protein
MKKYNLVDLGKAKKLNDKQKFDLMFKYHNFGYSCPEEVPFTYIDSQLRPLDVYDFYVRNREAIFRSEFLEVFIDVIDLSKYIDEMIQEYYVLAHVYELEDITNLGDIILNYKDISYNVFLKMISHFTLNSDFISDHIYPFAMFANEIRDNIFVEGETKLFSQEARLEKLLEAKTNNTNKCTKRNLITYYRLIGLIL